MTDLSNATLPEMRAVLAPHLGAHAGFDGWGDDALVAAANDIGLDPGFARLAIPGGATDMINAWFASVDAEMDRRLPPETLDAMKIRERITALVETQLDIMAADRDGLRRALSILAMPMNVPFGTKLAWRAADHMWRRAGDTATDYNHYTKRMILSGVYGSTISVFLDDKSAGQADTRAFLSRRIEGIMKFEKAKAGLLAKSDMRPSLSRFIGRLRYPAV